MSIVGSVAVRVVPSFTGMHKTIGRQFTGAGTEAGKTFSKSMGASMDLRSVGGAVQRVGDNIANVGGKLTKGITVPVAGATAAVGGLVGALGFKRLVGVDTARAKLQGLGYDVEDVERISAGVTDAIDGTMITMAEGTNIAVGALASGVEEGEELERYIRLVGDAANFAGVPIENMAEIFNRVQGSGKLMLGELNMLERQVPGSTAKLAESYGVSQEAFREMVSAGEVDAAHFIDVMDDFLGGAGEAYADSAAGLAKNALAYVGIIGESILSGAFQEAKGELSNFVDFLSSPAVQDWASDVGERVREIFTQIVQSVRSAIEWWMNLEGSTQRLILSIAGIAVAAGPVLLVVGKIISVIGGLISGIGVVVGWFSRLSTVLLGSTSNLTLLPRILTLVGNAFRFVTGPIGLVIGLLVAAWTQSEAFRTAIVDMGKAIWDAISGVWEALQPAFSGIGSAMSGVGEMAAWAGEMLGDGLAWVINTLIIPAIEWLGDAIAGVITWMTGLGDETTQQGSVMTSIWEWIQGAISSVVGWITGTAWPAIQSAWSGISSGAQWLWGIMESVWGWIQGAISGTVDWMTGTAWPMIQSVWDGISTGAQILYTILATIFTAVVAVFLALGQGLYYIYSTIIKSLWETFASIVQWVWNSIIKPVFGFIVAAFQALGTAFMWVWDNVVKPMWDMFVAIVQWVWTSIVQPIFRFIVQAFRNLGQGFMSIWKGVLKPVFDFFGAIIRWLWENVARPMFTSIGDSFQRMGNFLRSIYQGFIQPMFQRFGDFVGTTRERIGNAFNRIRDAWAWLRDRFRAIWNDGIRPIFQRFRDFITDKVVGSVRSAVDRIRDIWEKLKARFASPINWVIRNVVNKGLIGAFNKVAGFIPGVSKIGEVSEIGTGRSSGNRGNIPGYAKGGLAQRGWAMVGEEGPELVNFSNPGRVYTAEETQAALGTDAGYGIGAPSVGGVNKIAQWFATSDNAVSEWGRDKAGKAVTWARGALESAVNAVLEPIFDPLRSWASNNGQVGRFAVGTAEGVRDELLSWAKSDDEKASAEGVYDGPFTANPGGFNRPAGGPITSMAGPRSYIGRFGNMHYGVDIGVPIGSAIRAAFDGVISRIGVGGVGQSVLVNHGGFDTAYLHNSAITKSVGTRVTGGDIIARSGTAGSGPHLHFELHPGGWYNPSVGGVNSLFRDKGGLLYPGMNHVMNATGQAEYVFNQQQFENLNKIAASSNGGEGWQITQNNYQSGNQYRDAQDLRMTFRRERRKAGV